MIRMMLRIGPIPIKLPRHGKCRSRCKREHGCVAPHSDWCVLLQGATTTCMRHGAHHDAQQSIATPQRSQSWSSCRKTQELSHEFSWKSGRFVHEFSGKLLGWVGAFPENLNLPIVFIGVGICMKIFYMKIRYMDSFFSLPKFTVYCWLSEGMLGVHSLDSFPWALFPPRRACAWKARPDIESWRAWYKLVAPSPCHGNLAWKLMSLWGRSAPKPKQSTTIYTCVEPQTIITFLNNLRFTLNHYLAQSAKYYLHKYRSVCRWFANPTPALPLVEQIFMEKVFM